MAELVKRRIGFLDLSGEQMDLKQIYELQKKVLSGCEKSREEFIYQMVPYANKVAINTARKSELLDVEDVSSIAYSVIVHAVNVYKNDNNAVPMHGFVVFCIKRAMNKILHRANDPDRRDVVKLGLDIDPEHRIEPVDLSGSPDYSSQVAIDSDAVSSFLGRRLRNGGKHWEYFARYYGLNGYEPTSMPQIAREEGLTKGWMSVVLNRCLNTIRKELNVA